jgi:predicted ATPase
MLRQIADGIEALSEQYLLVLLLEDLHLSDHATLELIAALALRRGPAQLLIVGTFRDAEVHPGSTPFQRLKQQLLLHRQCEEIALAALDPETVADYLAKQISTAFDTGPATRDVAAARFALAHTGTGKAPRPTRGRAPSG